MVDGRNEKENNVAYISHPESLASRQQRHNTKQWTPQSENCLTISLQRSELKKAPMNGSPLKSLRMGIFKTMQRVFPFYK